MVTDVNYKKLATTVLTLAQAKKQLRIEPTRTDEDDLIQDYIDAAVDYCEQFTGGSIVDTELSITMCVFENPLVFEAFPLKSISEVVYFPASGGDAVTMAPEGYRLSKQSDKNYQLRFVGDLPKLAIGEDAVKVKVLLGYEAIPKGIVQAVRLKVADMYEYREDRAKQSSSVADHLLRAYKKY